MTKCYQDREERMDRRFATTQALYAQCHGAALTSDDFMGKRKEKTYPTDEQLEEQLTTIFGCGPGVTNV